MVHQTSLCIGLKTLPQIVGLTEIDLSEKACFEVEFLGQLKKKDEMASNRQLSADIGKTREASKSAFQKNSDAISGNISTDPSATQSQNPTEIGRSPRVERRQEKWELSQRIVGLEVEFAKMPNLTNEVESLSSKLKDLELEKHKLDEEKEQATSSLSLLRSEKEKLNNEFDEAKTKWKEEEKELKTGLALYHGPGFEKGIAQVQLLYPDLNLSQVDMFKEIVNGGLIDPPEDE
ncbi:hypothetical protein SESBI_24751 [Sesbania bispinosa]|nr:hypothetical protein SESBI_24751 [Sesbania bispinosa]